MEPRGWKLLHYSAQKILKQASPSPHKDKFLSSKDKKLDVKPNQVLKDRSNKLLYYVNSHLQKQSPANQLNAIMNNRHSLINKNKETLNSQYFQTNQKKVGFKNTIHPIVSNQQLSVSSKSLFQNFQRRDKCKTTFSALRTQNDSFQVEAGAKSASQRSGESGFQGKFNHFNQLEQYYEKN